MFGTMAVVLPSPHTGSDLKLEHAQREPLLYSSADESEWDMTWMAWFADVTHSVSPLLSGYRVAIIYNLMQHPDAHEQTLSLSADDCLAHHQEALAQLRATLDGWRVAHPNSMRLYGLEHPATQ